MLCYCPDTCRASHDLQQTLVASGVICGISSAHFLLSTHLAGRYSGYCAWRGLLKIPDDPEAAEQVQQAYADMGQALYFDIAKDTHAVVYRLPQDRLNWLW